jgi:hypothetical protein
MARSLTVFLIISGALFSFSCQAYAQPGKARPQRSAENKKNEPPPLPSDKRLLALHKSFVTEAEKLAGEYERDREWDKAKDVYGEILKLVPQYTTAQEKLNAIKMREATANVDSTEVSAKKDWQYSGIILQEGKPISIRATGKWTFVLEAETSPDGIAIPKELQEFKLGSLIGYIDTGNPENDKPFEIGAETSFLAKKTGKLYLRMYDSDPNDNTGSLKVEFAGSFLKK